MAKLVLQLLHPGEKRDQAFDEAQVCPFACKNFTQLITVRGYINLSKPAFERHVQLVHPFVPWVHGGDNDNIFWNCEAAAGCQSKWDASLISLQIGERLAKYPR